MQTKKLCSFIIALLQNDSDVQCWETQDAFANLHNGAYVEATDGLAVMAQRCLFQHAISRLHCWLHRHSPLLSKPQKTNAVKKNWTKDILTNQNMINIF